MKNWVESTSSKTFQILDLLIFDDFSKWNTLKVLWNFVKSSNMAKVDENSSSTHFSANSVYRKKKSDFGYRFHRSTQRGSTSNIIIASGRTRAYWFWFISCIMSGNIHLEILRSKMIFFLLLVFCAKCCFNICCEKNQINPSSCWFDVPPLRLHLSIIPNFNINCADSGLSRTLWTVVLFLEFCLVFLLKRHFWGNILYIWSKVF